MSIYRSYQCTWEFAELHLAITSCNSIPSFTLGNFPHAAQLDRSMLINIVNQLILIKYCTRFVLQPHPWKVRTWRIHEICTVFWTPIRLISHQCQSFFSSSSWYLNILVIFFFSKLFVWFVAVISLCGISVLANLFLIYLACNQATRSAYWTRRIGDERQLLFHGDDDDSALWNGTNWSSSLVCEDHMDQKYTRGFC